MSREPFTTAIPRFSVTRPVSVVMLLATIVVVGYIAYSRVRLSLFPEDLEGTQLHVSVSYPNASPRDIEEKITRKIEDIIGTVPDVRRLTSYAAPGYSYTRVEFQTGTNLREAYAQLSDRMDRVKPLLPDDVDRIYVRRYDPSTEPMMNLVAQVPREMDDAAYRLENFVKPALQRIDGVGNVDIWGVQSREINIDLIDERLRSHRIDVPVMLSALRAQNIAVSGGYVQEAGRKIYVRSLGRFSSVEQIASIIIDPVRKLRVADVANVSFRMPRREWVYRVDRQPSIGIQITRDSTGNIDRISRDVRDTLEELKQMPQLEGVRFEIFSDQGKDVRDAIEHLKDAGIWGGFFAALVLYTFLRAPRITGILTLSIPLSLLCTIIALFFMGWSLNLATMMGLLLAVGMVIDNAIVIVENIYRHRQEGRDATGASITGASEVGLAVVMSTFTTIVVFLPLILMGKGYEFSFWMFRIGVPVVISLLASLFIALVFVPLAAQRLSRGRHHEDIRIVAWSREKYSRALGWVLTHRLDAVIIVLLAVGTIWYPYSNVQRSGGGLMGRSGRGMHLYYDLPSGSTLEQADEFFGTVEDFLQKNAALYGVERIETRFRNNNGRIQLKLAQKSNDAWYVAAWESLLLSLDLAKPPMDRNDIEAHIRDNFPLPAGIICRSIARNTGAVQDTVISFSIFGEDTSTLIDLAEEASRRLRTIPGMLSVDTDMERGGQELRIHLDRDRSRRLGIDPREVSTVISNTIRGLEVGRMPVPDGREIRIYAQLGEADRTRIDDVKTMSFAADSGMDVPLESIANLSINKAMSNIYREARQTVMRITARVPPPGLSRAQHRHRQGHGGFRPAARLPLRPRQLFLPEQPRSAGDDFRPHPRHHLRLPPYGTPLRVLRPPPRGHHRRAVLNARRVLDPLPHRHPARSHGDRRHRHPRRRRREQCHRARRHDQPAATRGQEPLRGPDGRRPPPLPPDSDDHPHHGVRHDPDGGGQLEDHRRLLLPARPYHDRRIAGLNLAHPACRAAVLHSARRSARLRRARLALGLSPR